MAGRPALIREREMDKAISAARKAGAPHVKFEYAGVSITIPLLEVDETPVAPDSNNSFDKIMAVPPSGMRKPVADS